MASFRLYRNSNSRGLSVENCHLIPAASCCQLPCLSPTRPLSAGKASPIPAPAIRGHPGQTLPHVHLPCVRTSLSQCVRRRPRGEHLEKEMEGGTEVRGHVGHRAGPWWVSPPHYHAPRAGPLSIWENLLKLPRFFLA